MDESPITNKFTSVPALQIGIVILGKWKYTKKALQYLILLLNTKQCVFEYQIIPIEEYIPYISSNVDAINMTIFDSLLHNRTLNQTKEEINEAIENTSKILQNALKANTNFSEDEVPNFYIFISPSKHVDYDFFELDGIMLEEQVNMGTVLLTGHHCKKLAPPTVIEFIFKFIFRISVKHRNPCFSRECRHIGQKGCLFDYTCTPDLMRYMILHNFICKKCSEHIGEDLKFAIQSALDPIHLYGDNVDRHPAKISSELGFNLTLTKGIYKTNAEILWETISFSFLERLGSITAMGTVFAITLFFGINNVFVNED